MCGIAGIVSFDSATVESADLRAMATRLIHRGPDDEGFFGWHPQTGARATRNLRELSGPMHVGLAHRRLSIVDLTDGGWQPMSTADGRYHIVFNGEIYNYIELRRRLQESGPFHSGSDTEVLLRWCAEHGPSGIGDLTGMFAFVLLDTSRRELWLARDPFGIKPLYYLKDRGRLLFASEIPALLACTSTRRAEPRMVYDYLVTGLTDHDEQTMFDGVRQVPPASYAVVPLDGPHEIRLTRYWKLNTSKTRDRPFSEEAAEVRDSFRHSVSLHLRSDVPVSCALSGGIDSSSIVMAMRRDLGANGDIRTFSYIPDDATLSEKKWIDLVVAEARTQSKTTSFAVTELVNDLDRLIEIQGEPFGSTSIYAQNRVFQLVSEDGIKVSLDGQGADELLAGYRLYPPVRLAVLLRSGHLAAAMRLFSAVIRLDGMRLAPLFTQMLFYAAPAAFRREALRWLRPSWLDSGWFADRGVREPGWYASTGSLREMLTLDVTRWRLPHLLRYADRNSMSHSVESRVPFLIPRLAESVLSVPDHYLLADNGLTKAVFREAMRGLVPQPILNRRDKIGFATPERAWLGQLRPWVEHTLKGGTAQMAPLRTEVAIRQFERLASGSGNFDWRFWRWINLVKWAERFGVSFD